MIDSAEDRGRGETSLLNRRFAAGLILSILPLIAALGSGGCQPAYVATLPTGSFLIRDVRVFDGEQVLDHRTVVVVDGRIAQIGGPDLDSKIDGIDGRNRTLLPGFIDAHVHVGDDVEGILRQAVLLGVTTVLDMYSGGERLKRLKRVASEDSPHLAGLRTAGSGAAAPGGHPSQMGGPPLPTIASAGAAPAFVDARIAEGSDYIKVIYDDLEALGFKPPLPMLDKETLAAVIAAAHQRGRIAVVHVGTEQQAREAIAAGADGLAHLFLGETVSADFGEFAKRHGVFIIPTLSTLYTACGMSDGSNLLADPRLYPFIRPEWRDRLKMSRPGSAACKGAEEAIGQLVRAGVPILAGTDSPVPGTAYGASLHGELVLLVRHGLTPVQALAAATSAPARAFRLADRGLIRVGMRADLVLVGGDPTRDVLATRDIVTVWKQGVEVRRESFP